MRKGYGLRVSIHRILCCLLSKSANLSGRQAGSNRRQRTHGSDLCAALALGIRREDRQENGADDPRPGFHGQDLSHGRVTILANNIWIFGTILGLFEKTWFS